MNNLVRESTLKMLGFLKVVFSEGRGGGSI